MVKPTNEAMLRIVEIEARDFYFEISPADYQDEEANIRKELKEIKKSINPSGETYTREAGAHILVSPPPKPRIFAVDQRKDSKSRSTQETIRNGFDHPPTQQTENNEKESVSPPLALVPRENSCKGFQESSSTAEDGHNWLYQFKPVPAHCVLFKAPHCHLRHV